jgi:hypothetical protein
MRVVFILCCFAVAVFCGFEAYVNAWRLLTPLHPDKLFNAKLMLSLSLIVSSAAVALGVWQLRSLIRRKSERR